MTGTTGGRYAVDLSGLNPEQLAPVLATEGAVLVTAGAGSGKTRLLTHRIAHIIADLGVSPWNVLAITFTNKAADEMRTRLDAMLPSADGLWVSTFHSMCVRILRRYISSIGYTANFSIYTDAEKESVVKRIVKEDGIDADNFYKKVLSAIDFIKNRELTVDEYIDAFAHDEYVDKVAETYTKYNAVLKANNALDFDDLLIKTKELFTSNPEALEYYRNRFKYIHVDEFQDTNKIQYELVRLLGGKHGNVFVVGDEDQSIYGWRGAKAGNIFDFQRDFKCRVFKLEQNYRSTQKILDAANKLIANNTARMDKRLWTENGEGNKIECFTAVNETNESDYVVTAVNDLVRNYGYKYSDIAVLMRVNSLSRPFEEKFLLYNIPYKIFGGFRFYERKEIKDLLGYLRLLVNGNDEEAFMRVINFPKRGLGAGAIAQLRAYAAVQGKSMFDVAMEIETNDDLPPSLVKKVSNFTVLMKCLFNQKDKISISELITYLVRLMNLKEIYAEDTEENDSRKRNIYEFIDAAKQYSQANPDSTLEEYLQNITLYSDTDDMDLENDCINVATVHSAKGLEFRIVFVVGAEDGLFPISRAFDDPADMEEERRLMYVAITRAKERLFVTYASMRFMYGERRGCIPSRFLSEIGLVQVRPRAVCGEGRGELRRSYLSDFDDTAVSKKTVGSPVYKHYEAPKAKTDGSKFKVGDKVRHRKFGVGVIEKIADEVNGNYGEIAFESIGKVTLALNYAPLELIEE